MNKKQFIRDLKEQGYTLKKVSSSFFDFNIKNDHTDTYLKVIDIRCEYIITFNSRYFIEIKTGSLNGLKFKEKKKYLYDLRNNKDKNKKIVFISKPYKILKYINESDIVDISNDVSVYDFTLEHL